MVNSNTSYASLQLDAIFNALSDSTRRSILRSVTTEAKSVGDIARPFKMSLAAISKHLKVLERANLVVREKLGSFQMIKANPKAIKQGHRWLSHYEQFWDERLDTLSQSFIEKKRK
jgi:DNA-binding transcriptional ArsR family regulator